MKNNDVILPPENESVLPDHDLRRSIAAWRRDYTLAPPFSFITTPTHLAAAVTAILDRQEHQLEDRKLVQLLGNLNFALEGKSTIVRSREGFLSVTKLIAGCSLESTSDLTQWVHFSVGILANAHNFNYELDLGDYQHKMLVVLDRVCMDIHDASFQLGLLNLIKSLMASKEQIVNNSGIVRALSSYILSPGYGRFRKTKQHFDQLFHVILGLWVAEAALEQPKLLQAVASIVWPLQEKIDGPQYVHLLQTISYRLNSQCEGRTLPSSLPVPFEAITRSGLVSRIFNVLDYATLPEAEKKRNLDGWFGRGELTSPEAEELVVMRCFEMLEYLSMSSIGRLEIVRVIRGSSYRYLSSFYSALAENTLPRQKESHVLPALSMIFNVLKYARYTPLLERVRGQDYQKFVRLLDDRHPRVSRMANQIFRSYAKIRREEKALAQHNY